MHPGKKFPLGELWEKKQLLTHKPLQAMETLATTPCMGTQNLDCIKEVPPEEKFRDPHHQQVQGEEGPMGVTTSLLHHPHSFLSLYLTVNK